MYSGVMGNILSLNTIYKQLSLNLWVNLLNCGSQLLCSLTGISFFLLVSLSKCTSCRPKFPWVWFHTVFYTHPEEKQTVSIYATSVTSHTSHISIHRLEFFFKKKKNEILQVNRIYFKTRLPDLNSAGKWKGVNINMWRSH